MVSISDVRETEIKGVFHWFQGWMTEISVIDVSTKQKGKMLPSQKCLDDFESCILVFLRVCLIQTTCLKGKGIYDLIQTLLKTYIANKKVCIMDIILILYLGNHQSHRPEKRMLEF